MRRCALFVLASTTMLLSSSLFAQFVQQGPKLVGTGAVGNAFQGYSTALSADGSTAIFGGIADDTRAGGVWVFTRTNGVWNQQGSKLVGLNAIGAAFQGFSVALSADGNTAIVGGPSDNGTSPTSIGAAWIFVRSGSTWINQAKLVGMGGVGSNQLQGRSVAISADGSTAIM